MTIDRGQGELFIGEEIAAEDGQRTGERVLLDSADFTTHGVIVGMTDVSIDDFLLIWLPTE